MRQPKPTLLEAATYLRSKSQLIESFIYKTIFLGCLVGSIILYFAPIDNVLFMVATVEISIIFSLYCYMRILHRQARQAQRLALIEDGFGSVIDPVQTEILMSLLPPSLTTRNTEILHFQPYYTGSRSPGMERIFENLQQSIFWTTELLVYRSRILIRNATVCGAIVILFFTLMVYSQNITFGLTLIFEWIVLSISVFFLLNIYWLIEGNMAVRAMRDLDRRLEAATINRADHLVAAFADYAVLVSHAPIISAYLHKRNKSFIRQRWDRRLEQKNSNNREVGDELKCKVSVSSIPDYIGYSAFESLLRKIAIRLSQRSDNSDWRVGLIEADRIPSYGNVPVFDLKIFTPSGEIYRRVILRLHPNADSAREEVQAVKRVTYGDPSLVPFVPPEESLIDSGAIVYYHANIQNHDMLVHLDQHIVRYMKGNFENFEQYFYQCFHGLKRTFSLFNKLSNKSLKTVEEVVQGAGLLTDTSIPIGVIDARSEIIRIQDRKLIIGDAITELPGRIVATIGGIEHYDAGVMLVGRGSAVHSLGADSGELTLSLEGGDLAVLLPTKAMNNLKNLKEVDGVCFVPKRNLVSLSKGLYGFEVSDWPRLVNYRNFKDFVRDKGKRGLLTGFRHDDLHCGNILVSPDHFTLIDFAGSKEALYLKDLCRLEISLLSRVCEALELSREEILLVLRVSGGEILETSLHVETLASLVARIREECKGSLDFEISEPDEAMTYILEIMVQIRYSFYSPVKYPQGMLAALDYWAGRMRVHD